LAVSICSVVWALEKRVELESSAAKSFAASITPNNNLIESGQSVMLC